MNIFDSLSYQELTELRDTFARSLGMLAYVASEPPAWLVEMEVAGLAEQVYSEIGRRSAADLWAVTS